MGYLNHVQEVRGGKPTYDHSHSNQEVNWNVTFCHIAYD